jgi:hypothetical protein
MALDRFGQPYGSSWAGMSMGEGGIKPIGVWNSCPDSIDPHKRHMMRVLSNVQSVEHFKCTTPGCDAEWVD